MSEILTHAQARLTFAADTLDTLEGHLARYRGLPAETVLRHLRGDTHHTEVTSAIEDDAEALRLLHSATHGVKLAAAIAELASAENWLAAVQADPEAAAQIVGVA
jgi:hypothetical protein